jgi:TonB family protein
MFKPKSFANSLLPALIVLTFTATASAQNNLTAKVNSLQPHPVAASVESDRVRDGLAGPVRRVRTEVAKISSANGSNSEAKRVVLETAAYDIKGAKTENQYFPVAGSSLTGKEVYKYDERGNISEMTLVNSDGSLLGKEVYKYDYDSVGNWTRMTTSVAVVEGGKVTFEPTEVTYRAITYYLDENVLKMAQPATSAAAETAKPVSAPVVVPEVKSQPSKKPADNKAAGSHQVAATNLPAVNSGSLSNAAASSVLTNNVTANSNSGTAVAMDPPPPPAANTPKPLLKPVSGGVLNGKAMFLPAPAYPEAAKRMRTAGVVTVDVVVDETGKVISAVASGGPAVLRDVAIQAATKAKFSPTMLSGQPVKVSGVINYKFSLTQ